jgi:SAM-dependent methyltransferase
MAEAADYRAITARQQATWSDGDYHQIGRQALPVSESLCRAVDPHAGQRVLDVACGSGNAALVAGRRYCEVTGVDYVPALLERAKARALAEGMTIDFRVGDAQALPFPDASFDAVLSVFGVMFAPDQEKAAGELLRVCRPGGRIGLACWTPDGFGGEFFRTVAKYAPPPPGTKPSVRWGTDEGLKELLGPGVSSVRSEERTMLHHYRSVGHAVELFRTYFGPVKRAFDQLDAKGQESLRRDMEALYARQNRATDGTLILESTYRESVLVRK